MITSVQNDRIKHIAELSKKAKLRAGEDVFLAEGIRLFEEIPEGRITDAYFTEDAVRTLTERGHSAQVEALLRSGRATLVSDAVYAKMSDVVTPQGALAVVRRYHYVWEELLDGAGAPLLLLLEDIRDPGNLGTILRTAEAAGVTGVVLGGDTADIYAPKVERATMGAINRVAFLYERELTACIAYLRECGVRIHAAALDAGAAVYTACDYRGGTAFLIGNEANGLCAKTIAAADETVYIPMQGHAESLNAAVSAAVLLYEAARQRY